ncbi:histidine phosphatase family protein [Planotetraspora kaengkrachanensis]|uniref:Phosphoglycerate mutase n=1 Tax=Planotetraspora kaengkrachanensis TaxID=575193 RepID=A0A8J3Q041_9ACTN|nr:histidine phosphatase family protein [Planotetraspora kaengkrachanensis]GIG84331.1 phosphoglycerate mutase [Planotetraspora kaengkrachanensis]
MTTRLLLICHAFTAATAAASFPGDEPVEERRLHGHCEGSLAAPYTDGLALRGPELRCAQTADWLGLAAEPVPQLGDCDFGGWRGRTLADVQAADPEGVSRWLGDPTAAPHGGESVVDVVARVGEWLAGLAAGRVVAVTHPSVIRAAVVHTLGTWPGAFWRIDVEPLSRAELTGRGGRWNLRLAAAV